MNIYEKLLEIKKHVPYLQKKTKGFNYDYCSPEEVLGTLNPLFENQKLIIIPETTSINYQIMKEKISKSGNKTIEVLYIVDTKYTIINCEKPEEKIIIKWNGTGCNDEEKGYGSALTYSLRYFMLNLFQIPTGKDDPDAKQNEFNDVDGAKNDIVEKALDIFSGTLDGKEFLTPEEKVSSTPKSYKISESQVKRLYTLASKNGVSNDDAKSIVKKYGYDSSKDITTKDYEKICTEIELTAESKKIESEGK
jgi:hypothetical protein